MGEYRKLLALDRSVKLAVLVAALGYFVDVYDIVLFSVTRVQSLRSLGVPEGEILPIGASLLQIQMFGMLCGGVLWGILGDKRGRIQVLFGSILLYSVANILNAFVQSVPQYAALRFIAGVGLAGEIGAGITLVSELLPKETRGIGTTLVATIGVSGAVAAAIVANLFPWQTAYIIGGVGGLALLLLRVSVHESGMFKDLAQKTGVSRGDFRLLFASRDRFIRYVSCILVGLPIWYVIGIVITFAPEIGKALGVTGELRASDAVLVHYIGLTLGDLSSGLLSQWLKSRKKALAFFVALTCINTLLLLNLRGASPQLFYLLCTVLGFFVGYWAVFITTAAEQFGTNLRATVATTVPNFVRGAAVPVTQAFKELSPALGAPGAAQAVGLVCFAIAGLSLFGLRETFGKDLDYIEES